MITIPLDPSTYRLGVISDTHGLLRPETVRILDGVHLIIHAGDVGTLQVIETLRQIAPVIAVRGNMDRGGFGLSLPEFETLLLGDYFIYVLHDIIRFYGTIANNGYDIVISGHTHRPEITRDGSITYLNPGSAGPRRPGLPVTLAIVEFKDNKFTVRHFDLESH